MSDPDAQQPTADSAKLPSKAPSKAPSIASARRARSESPVTPIQVSPVDVDTVAKELFEAEERLLDEYRAHYEQRLRTMRMHQLRQDMAMIDAETPRLLAAIRDNKYTDIIEDRALVDQMANDAQQQANGFFMKYRTARGLGNLAKDTSLVIQATQESINKYGKLLANAQNAAKDLIKLASDSDDAEPRITFITKVQPQWHLLYELLYARTKQWLYAVSLFKLLADGAQRLSKSAIADRVRQEVNTLEVDMTDDDDDEMEVSDDGDDSSHGVFDD